MQILVTQQSCKSAAPLSSEDSYLYDETLHLMASPENARRLNESVAEVNSGKAGKHGIIDD